MLLYRLPDGIGTVCTSEPSVRYTSTPASLTVPMTRLFDGSLGWTQNDGSSASFVPAGLRSIVSAVAVTVDVAA